MPRGQVVPVKPLSLKDDREEEQDPILQEEDASENLSQEEGNSSEDSDSGR